MKNLSITLCVMLMSSWLMAQTTLNGGIATTSAGTNLVLRTGSSTTARLTILDAAGGTQGYIGIGLTPTQRLHVSGNILSSADIMAGSGIFNASSGDMSLRTSGTPRLTIVNSTGRVGIGNASPAQALDVNGSILASSNIMSTAGVFNASGSSNLSLQTSGTPRLTILNSDGKVGINTTSPAQALDVNGTVKAIGFMVGSTPLVSSQWATAASNINYTAGTVSIGTTTAPVGYKLAVGGKTITAEVVVKPESSGWPDYVFESDYELMPLSALERYVKQNKHLPDVPTAKEVDSNGVALGELNATLLKKVEELTLYMIELKKENEAQQKLIDELIKKH